MTGLESPSVIMDSESLTQLLEWHNMPIRLATTFRKEFDINSQEQGIPEIVANLLKGEISIGEEERSSRIDQIEAKLGELQSRIDAK